MKGADVQASSAAERRVGTWIKGKYHLDAVLGEGGMAVVYSATHRNKKRFAVKVLREGLASADAIRRFLREGYVANTVEHEGAVAVLDDDVADDGSAFLVMELLDGESVERLERGGKADARVVLAIAHQLLDVLVAAHAKGVVHRDIKPANLFVTTAGRLKVLDFGIARIREAHEAASATHTGATMGTPSFMAPEQARGKASEVSDRTDVWAVGATMFTLLSGRYVHEGESPQELVVSSATLPARSLATVAEQPAALVSLVDRALAFDPNDRWPDAAAMRDAVGNLHVSLFGETVPAAVPLTSRVTVRTSDPNLAAADTDAAAATVAIAPKTQELTPVAEALSFPAHTTGEPVAHTAGTEPAPRGRGRLVAIVVGGLAVAAVLATLIVMRIRRDAAEASEVVVGPRVGGPTTAVGDVARPPATSPPAVVAPSASVPVLVASAPSSSAGAPSTARPPPPRTSAPKAVPTASGKKGSDWDHQ